MKRQHIKLWAVVRAGKCIYYVYIKNVNIANQWVMHPTQDAGEIKPSKAKDSEIYQKWHYKIRKMGDQSKELTQIAPVFLLNLRKQSWTGTFVQVVCLKINPPEQECETEESKAEMRKRVNAHHWTGCSCGCWVSSPPGISDEPHRMCVGPICLKEDWSFSISAIALCIFQVAQEWVAGVLAAVFLVSNSVPELYPEALLSRATYGTNSWPAHHSPIPKQSWGKACR